MIRKAQFDGPQIITRRSRAVAFVVVAEDRFRKTRRQGNSATFFASSQLRASGIRIARRKDVARKVRL